MYCFWLSLNIFFICFPLGFESPYSANEIETIDLIDADSSNDVQDIDMFDSSDRPRNRDGSGSSNPDLMSNPHPSGQGLRITEVNYLDPICDVGSVVSLGEDGTLLNVSSQENQLLGTNEDSTISVINLADSPESPNRNTDTPPGERTSLNTPETYADERTSVIATSSCDKTVIDAPPTEASNASRLSEDFLANADPDESASPSNSNDTVLHQPRISTPSLISDDAVPWYVLICNSQYISINQYFVNLFCWILPGL